MGLRDRFRNWRSPETPANEDESACDANPGDNQFVPQNDCHMRQRNIEQRVLQQQNHLPNCPVYFQNPGRPNIRQRNHPENTPRIHPRLPDLLNRHTNIENDPNIGLPAVFPECVYRTRNAATRRQFRTYQNEDVTVQFQVRDLFFIRTRDNIGKNE